MPFTPYHFGPALLLGVLLFPFTDLATIVIASVVLDLEPLAVIFLNLSLPLHGFFHTYLGASIAASVLSVFVYPFRTYLNKIASLFGLHQNSSLRHIMAASFVGTYSHVFLDSFLYAEMNPFFPIIGNPLLGLLSSGDVYMFCVIAGLIGFLGYVLRAIIRPRMSDLNNGPLISCDAVDLC
ncbi:MAG: hypothetical protein ACFFCP_06440 [Promethearchaeota archaeon]